MLIIWIHKASLTMLACLGFFHVKGIFGGPPSGSGKLKSSYPLSGP